MPHASAAGGDCSPQLSHFPAPNHDRPEWAISRPERRLASDAAADGSSAAFTSSATVQM
jgi:hypothetical protein